MAGRAAGGVGFAPPLVPRMDAPTPFDELATVPDPRSRHGQRHPLPAILGMVALAMPTGRTRLAGIARLDPADAEHPSLDGKTLRGSRGGEVPGVHRVAAFAPRAQAVLARVRVDAQTNEHTAALERLGILPVAGKVVVGDALFCQRDLAAKVVGEGGDDLLAVTDNREALTVDISASRKPDNGMALPGPQGPRVNW